MILGLLLLAALGLGLHLATCVLVALRLARPGRPSATDLTRVALLRPVCGLDRFDEETLGSSFRLDHADLDVVFCAARADDPAVPLVRRLMAENPGVRARLLIGAERPTGNPKLDNLAKGWAATDAPWVVMADSNLLLPPDYLARLAAVWDEGTGLASSPPLGVRPEGVWAAVECAVLNTNQMRLQLTGDSLGRGYAQGKTLLWRRADLDALGGIAALGHKLAEDAAATLAVRASGRHVRLTRKPFEQPIGRRSLREVWDRQLRWSRVRRDGFPGLFLLEPLNGPALPALALLAALLAAGASPLWLVAYLLPWYAAEAALALGAGWPMGGRGLLALPLRDALLPALWVASFLGRGFEWRGTAMAPDREAPTT